MLLSVILITWNGRELLAECLKSMAFLMARADVEIFVVDNGSEDGTVDFLRNRYPAVKVIPLGSNYGVAYARNRALERACGRYLWILDNDTEINPDVFYGMLHYMEEHPDVGLAGCRLIDADGLVQESCKRYPGIGEKIRNLLLKKGYRYAYGLKRMKENFEPEYVIGACQFKPLVLWTKRFSTAPRTRIFAYVSIAQVTGLCIFPASRCFIIANVFRGQGCFRLSGADT